jgi:hypothetical protein
MLKKTLFLQIAVLGMALSWTEPFMDYGYYLFERRFSFSTISTFLLGKKLTIDAD